MSSSLCDGKMISGKEFAGTNDSAIVGAEMLDSQALPPLRSHSGGWCKRRDSLPGHQCPLQGRSRLLGTPSGYLAFLFFCNLLILSGEP
jgi:hypothetical protein